LEIRTNGQTLVNQTLDCNNWIFTGSGYKYVDVLATGGIEELAWKSGKLKISLGESQYVAPVGPVSWLEARLTVGTRSITPCTSDGNPCTNDECNGAGACGHPNNTAPCNDNIFCNGPDTCNLGACTGHSGNPCSGGDGDNNCNESCSEAADNCLAQDPNGAPCSDGQGCNGADSCSSGLCTPSGVCCGTRDFTFTINSNSGGVFDSAEWPASPATASQSNPVAACNVTVNLPSGNIDLVGTLGDNFCINGFNGFQNCFGSGGEDGDGCQVLSCPPAGIGSCEAARPSCSAALNGSGSARYLVHCVDP
jgi:hypothetical protein